MIKKIEVQVSLKNNEPSLYISPKKPFGIYLEKHKNHTQIAAIKIELDLTENVLEEILWTHPSPLNKRKEDTWQLFWSNDSNRLLMIGANQALLVFDFLKQTIYSKEEYIDTKNWSYFQCSQEIFN